MQQIIIYFVLPYLLGASICFGFFAAIARRRGLAETGTFFCFLALATIFWPLTLAVMLGGGLARPGWEDEDEDPEASEDEALAPCQTILAGDIEFLFICPECDARQWRTIRDVALIGAPKCQIADCGFTMQLEFETPGRPSGRCRACGHSLALCICQPVDDQ